MDKKEAEGLEPNPKRPKTSYRKVNEDEDFGGELEDLWDTPR